MTKLQNLIWLFNLKYIIKYIFDMHSSKYSIFARPAAWPANKILKTTKKYIIHRNYIPNKPSFVFLKDGCSGWPLPKKKKFTRRYALISGPRYFRITCRNYCKHMENSLSKALFNQLAAESLKEKKKIHSKPRNNWSALISNSWSEFDFFNSGLFYSNLNEFFFFFNKIIYWLERGDFVYKVNFFVAMLQNKVKPSSSAYSSFPPMSVSGIQGQLLEVTGMFLLFLLLCGFIIILWKLFVWLICGCILDLSCWL